MLEKLEKKKGVTMFEKEAKEYAIGAPPIFSVAKEAFQKGAELAYNKANEWHYPSKGELPKEDTAEKETLYLLWFGLNDSDYMTGVFSHGRFWCFDCGWFDVKEVVAWKKLIPPSLDKEKADDTD